MICIISESFKFQQGIYPAASEPLVNAVFYQNFLALLSVNIALILVLLENKANGLGFLMSYSHMINSSAASVRI